MKKSKMKTLAIALCATAMSGLYATEVNAQYLKEGLTINPTGGNTYFEINNNNVKIETADTSVTMINDFVFVNGGQNFISQTNSPNNTGTRIKQGVDGLDNKQEIELNVINENEDEKADSRILINSNRVDLDVNDEVNDIHANRVVETDEFNGMKIWDQISTSDRLITHNQTKYGFGNYVSEMAPDPNVPSIMRGTGKRSENNQTLTAISSTVAKTGYFYQDIYQASEKKQTFSKIEEIIRYKDVDEENKPKYDIEVSEKMDWYSINDKVRSFDKEAGRNLRRDSITDYVKGGKNGYTSEVVQKDGMITSKVSKKTVNTDNGETTEEFLQVDQNKYGINVKDQDSGTYGSWISATNMSIVDLENTGKRISLSHVGQIANLDAELLASLKASNSKVTVVNALNSEVAERRANDIVAGNISVKGEITLTKGDKTTVAAGTVSDSSLSKVDFDKETGNLTLSTTDKYGNDAQKDFTVEGLADRDYVDNAVDNVNKTITNNNNIINESIKTEITNRENNDIVSGDISAKGEVTLTKGDGSTVKVGIVSDNSLSKAEFDTKTGSLILTTTDKYGNGPEKKLTVEGIASQDYVDNAIKEADKTIINNITNNINEVKKDITEEIENNKTELIQNDIKRGEIGDDGEVALYRNDGTKIDVGTVSDNRLSQVDFDAEKGELKFTVTDKYGNDPCEVFVEDIASKSALDKETQDRIEADNIINNRITKMDGKMSKVGAGAAALAALHPLDFDADDKLSFAAGVGNYDGENATAIGAFYRPTEKVMLSASGTVGNGENMVNMGISFALDKPNNVSNTRVAMGQEILELRARVAYQNAQLEAQGQKLSELMQLVGQLTGNRGLLLEAKALRAEVFPDVPENHWAYEYIEGLRQRGIIEGYEDGYFRGDKMMTRYEFATMLFRAMQKGEVLNDRIAAEFEPELGRIRVDRIKGIDTDTDKVERVRVVSNGNRDDYGYELN